MFCISSVAIHGHEEAKSRNGSSAQKLVFMFVHFVFISSKEYKLYRTKIIQIYEVFTDLQYCLQ